MLNILAHHTAEHDLQLNLISSLVIGGTVLSAAALILIARNKNKKQD